MSATRRKRGARYHARKPLRIGPYFRHFSTTVTANGGRAGWTSQGFKFGQLTANTTTGRYTWDNPGPGSVSNDIPEWIMRALPSFLTKQPTRTSSASGGGRR